MIVLIDNGHGADTPGKASPDGRYREYAHTRKLARLVVAGLVAKGVDARLLTPEDKDISLATRVARANAIAAKEGKKNVMVVSIHSDAAGMGEWKNARGWSIWTSPGKTESDTIATYIYNAMAKALEPYGRTFGEEERKNKQRPLRSDMSDGDPDFEARFYILTKTSCPAVLTENLFHDNREDVAFLLSEEGTKAIVQGHVEGIINYINSRK